MRPCPAVVLPEKKTVAFVDWRYLTDGDDPFLLVITPELQLALAIPDQQERQLPMRCDADSLSDTLTLVGERLNATEAGLAEELREQLTGLGPLHSDPDSTDASGHNWLKN